MVFTLNLIILTLLLISQYDTYIGYDAAEKFVETIIRIYNSISEKLNNYSKANQ